MIVARKDSLVDKALMAYAAVILTRRRARYTHLALGSVPEARKKAKGYHLPLMNSTLKADNAQQEFERATKNLSADEVKEFTIRATKRHA